MSDKWDVWRPAGSRTNFGGSGLGLTMDRAWSPNVFTYNVTVPNSVPNGEWMSIILYQDWTHPNLNDFEVLFKPTNLGQFYPGADVSWMNAWRPAGLNSMAEMTVVWQGQNSTPPVVFQVRHTPTGEVRTYTFDFVAAP